MHERHSGANDIIEDVPADPESKNPRQGSNKPETKSFDTGDLASYFQPFWEIVGDQRECLGK